MSRVRSVFAVVRTCSRAVGQTTLPEPLAAARLTAITQARNAEIAASIATVNAARVNAKIEAMITKAQEVQFARMRDAEIEATVAAVAAVRASEFEHARNAEIETVLAAYREAQFARQRNAEIDTSISAVSVERGREYVRELNARAMPIARPLAKRGSRAHVTRKSMERSPHHKMRLRART